MNGENIQRGLHESFCREHGIDILDVSRAYQKALEVLPKASIVFDTEKYAFFGILRMEFQAPGVEMLPMLFGKLSNLARLARSTWEISANTWSDEMTDLTHRGTYLKKRVLIPAILDCVSSNYGSEARMLDVGCGDGVLFRELVSCCDNVFGVDCVESFTSRLADEFPSLRNRLKTVDIVDDDFDGSFDIVIASALLLTVPDINRALERLINLVALGGVLIIADVCARLHRSIGYYQGTSLIQVHDPNKVHHFEKNVGGGQTIAVHNYHPPGYYRQHLEAMGAVCVIDKEILASREKILADPLLSSDQKKIVLERMSNDLVNPTFFLLAMSRNQ